MCVCRLCGKSAQEIGGYLTRVNEKGVLGIWECRPTCDADLPFETNLLMALEGEQHRNKRNEMTPQQIQDSITQEQADRHAAKNAVINRLETENAALKEQVAQLQGKADFLHHKSECLNMERVSQEKIISQLQSKSAALVDALEDAATSLETIAVRSYGEESYLDSKPQMRGYAASRAGVVREALAALQGEK